MRNVTISLDDETAAWVRVHAAEKDTSISRLVADLIAEKRRGEDSYVEAMRQFFSRKPFDLNGPPTPYPKREELYDRAVLRRR